MFVNLIEFPPIKAGKDAEFRRWFEETNREYAQHPGFIRRRLLKPTKGGAYLGLVEHASYETFMAMHTSPTQAAAHERVEPLFEGGPRPSFHEVVLG